MLYCVLWCDISGVTLITIVMVLQFHASGGCEVRGGRWEVGGAQCPYYNGKLQSSEVTGPGKARPSVA